MQESVAINKKLGHARCDRESIVARHVSLSHIWVAAGNLQIWVLVTMLTNGIGLPKAHIAGAHAGSG